MIRRNGGSLGEVKMMGVDGCHVVQDLHGLGVKEILEEGQEGGVRDETKMRHFTGASSDFYMDCC
jgi:hypothetical protein